MRRLQGNIRSRGIGILQSESSGNIKTRTRVGEETLCWTCAHAYPSRGCSWAKRRIPVEGWIAQEHNYATVKKTYEVMYCPEYENDSCSLLKEGAECDRVCYECPYWKDSYGHSMRVRF